MPYQDPDPRNPYKNRRNLVLDKLLQDVRQDQAPAAQAAPTAPTAPAQAPGAPAPAQPAPSPAAPAQPQAPTGKPADRIYEEIQRVRESAARLRERTAQERAARNAEMAERAQLVMGSSIAPPAVPGYLQQPGGAESPQPQQPPEIMPQPGPIAPDTGPVVHPSDVDPLGFAQRVQGERTGEVTAEEVMVPLMRAVRESIVEQVESQGTVGRAITGTRVGVREAPGAIGLLLRLGLPENQAIQIIQEEDPRLGVSGTIARWGALLSPAMMEILLTKRVAATAAPHVPGRTGQLLNVIGRSEGKTISQSMATGALEGVLVDVIDAIEHGDPTRAGIGMGLGAATGPFVDAIGRYIARRASTADQELIGAVVRADWENINRWAPVVAEAPTPTAKEGLTPQQERALNAIRDRESAAAVDQRVLEREGPVRVEETPTDRLERARASGEAERELSPTERLEAAAAARQAPEEVVPEPDPVQETLIELVQGRKPRGERGPPPEPRETPEQVAARARLEQEDRARAAREQRRTGGPADELPPRELPTPEPQPDPLAAAAARQGVEDPLEAAAARRPEAPEERLARLSRQGQEERAGQVEVVPGSRPRNPSDPGEPPAGAAPAPTAPPEPSPPSRGGVPRVNEQARAYVRQHAPDLDAGLPDQARYLEVPEDQGKAVADVYDRAPDFDDRPEVLDSYRAFAQETKDQFLFLQEQGVKFEPWRGEGQPYRNSAEMIEDIEKNGHLWYFPTKEGFDDPTAGRHPLLQKSGVIIDGEDVPYNDLFRAVHDYFGHAKEGFQFGPRGEHNAWGIHSAMYSPRARGAMGFETRGQNSWVNFGPHIRRADGSIPKQGDPDFIPLTERPYAPQKVGVLPDEFRSVEGRTRRPGAQARLDRLRGTRDLPDEVRPQARRIDDPGVRDVVSRAFRDQTTGLPNRQALDAAQKRLDADEGTEWVGVDLKNLKAVNDQVSMEAGDAYIARAGQAIRAAADELGVPFRNVFRSGGDEFMAAVPVGRGADFEAAVRKHMAPEAPVGGFELGPRFGFGKTTVEANASVNAAKKAETGPKFRDTSAKTEEPTTPEELRARARRQAARDIAAEKRAQREAEVARETQSKPLQAEGVEGYSVRKGPGGWEVVRPNGQAGRRGFSSEKEALAAIPSVARLDGLGGAGGRSAMAVGAGAAADEATREDEDGAPRSGVPLLLAGALAATTGRRGGVSGWVSPLLKALQKRWAQSTHSATGAHWLKQLPKHTTAAEWRWAEPVLRESLQPDQRYTRDQVEELIERARPQLSERVASREPGEFEIRGPTGTWRLVNRGPDEPVLLVHEDGKRTFEVEDLFPDEEDIARTLRSAASDMGEGYQVVGVGRRGPFAERSPEYEQYTQPGDKEAYYEFTIHANPRHGEYRSPHFVESMGTNTIVHVRASVRRVDDRRVLYVEEVQSDWHQAGQKMGYATGISGLPPYETIQGMRAEKLSSVVLDAQERFSAAWGPQYREAMREAARNMADYWGRATDIPNHSAAAESILRASEGLAMRFMPGDRYYTVPFSPEQHGVLREMNEWISQLPLVQQARELHGMMRSYEAAISGKPPEGPFKNTEEWTRLAIRRSLEFAAERNLDGLAVVGGSQVNKMFSLGSHFDRVRVINEGEDRWAITTFRGGRADTHHTSASKTLEDYVGASVARRVRSEAPLPGQQWNADGQALDLIAEADPGARPYYDEIVAGVLRKEASRLGLKVGRAEVVPAGLGSAPSKNLYVPMDAAAKAKVLSTPMDAGFTLKEVAQSVVAGGVGATVGAAGAPEGEEGLGAVLVGTAAAILGSRAGRQAAAAGARKAVSGLRVRGDFLDEQHAAKVARASNLSEHLQRAEFILRDMNRAIEAHVGAGAATKAAHRQGAIELLDDATAQALNDVLQHRPAREAIQNWARSAVTSMGLTGKRLATVQRELDRVLEGDPLPSRIYRFFDDFVYGERQWIDEAMLPVIYRQIDDLAKNTPLPLNALPAPLRQPALDMRLQVEQITAEMKRIGLVQDSPASAFDLNDGLYLNRSYRAIEAPEAWQKFIEETPQGQALWNRAVADVRARNPSWSEADVENFLQDLLQRPETHSDILSGRKLGAKNLSIVTRRGDITPAVRAMMGENGDPLVQYYASVMKMSNMLENHRFLVALRDEGLGRNIFTEDTRPRPGTQKTVQIASEGSKTYEPLNGLYVTPELKEALERAVEGPKLDSAIMLFLARGNAISKFAKTVLSPMTQVRNMTGSHFTLAAQGSMMEGSFYRHYTRGFEVAHGAKVMGVGDTGTLRGGYGDGMSKRDYILDLTRRGVIDESVTAGTLEDLRAEAFRRMRAPSDPDAIRVLTRAQKVAGAQLDNAVAMYRAGDDFAKIVQFEVEFERYLKAFKGDRNAAAARAAQIVRDVLPTYSQVPWAINQLRRFPIFGTFVSFPYEVLRNTSNTFRLAASEMADPVTREIGVKRMAGIISTLTAGPVAATAIAQKAGVSAQDDKDIREFLPYWSENSVLMYHDFDPSTGNASFVDISYTDPFSYLQKPIVAWITGGDHEKALFEGGLEMARAFFGQEIFFGALLQSVEDVGRASTATDKLAVVMGNIADAVEPGFVTQATRVLTGHNNMSVGAYLRGQRPTREIDRTTEAMAIASGLRVTDLNVETALRFRAYEYQGEIRAARRRYDALARSVKEYPESDLLKQANRYLDSEEQINARYRRMAFAAARLGVPPEKVRQAMRDGGMSNATIERILTGGG